MDLFWLFVVEMKCACYIFLAFLNNTSTVVHFLMMTKKHVVE